MRLLVYLKHRLARDTAPGPCPLDRLTIGDIAIQRLPLVLDIDLVHGHHHVDVLASYGDLITLVRGRARLRADGTVVLDDGHTIKAGRIVIATRAEPRILSLGGIEGVKVLASTSAMALETQPRTLLVIGGRAIALELGQTF